MTNIDTKPTAKRNGVSNLKFPPQSVPSQLNVLIAEGTAMTIVETMKLVPRNGFIPDWNM